MTYNHQKNGYSKILGIVFLVVAFAAVVSLVYYEQITHQPINLNFLNDKKDEKGMAQYSNNDYQFAFAYPKAFQLDLSGKQENYFKIEGDTLADVSIPQSQFDKTNFGQAQITFAVKERSTLADCQTYVYGETAKKMTKMAHLGEWKFYADHFMDAAAGTAYTTRFYRILQGDVCYEASLTVGIGNIANYPEGAVTEVVEADVWNQLSAILISFKFIDAVAASGTDSGKGTLQGRVDIGPNCPVEQIGNPCAPSPDAYEGVQIIVYTEDRNTIVTKSNLNSTGHYSIDLAAGTYYVTYTSVYNFYQPPMKKITVNGDMQTSQNFLIDTGIR